MTALLELLIAFIGVILVLALASQSLLEAAKTIFPVEGFTRMGSARMLLEESARAAGLPGATGRDIYRAVAERLARLGQKGWIGVRLDTLTRDQLVALVRSFTPGEVRSLQDATEHASALGRVADSVERWYDLAMEPVADRYVRRMRVVNILGATAIVLFFNVDAIGLMQRLRTDTELRSQLVDYAGDLHALRTAQDSLELLVQGDSGAVASIPPATVDSIAAQLDTIQARVGDLVSQTTGIFDPGVERRWGDGSWQLGILLSILLVSLGAPFWNDLLGTIFGLKKQVEARTSRAGPGDAADGAEGGDGADGRPAGRRPRKPEPEHAG